MIPRLTHPYQFLVRQAFPSWTDRCLNGVAALELELELELAHESPEVQPKSLTEYTLRLRQAFCANDQPNFMCSLGLFLWRHGNIEHELLWMCLKTGETPFPCSIRLGVVRWAIGIGIVRVFNEARPQQDIHPGDHKPERP